MLTRYKKSLLADALLENYPDEVITGYVMNACLVSGSLIGNAYKTWGYALGERLVSGAVTEIIQYEHRWLIKTREHDCLVIVNFAPGGRRSLSYLIDLFQSARLAQSRWCLH
jgi:hypothetical protein